MAWNDFIHSDFYVRFLIYGFLGFIFEILFTAISGLICPKFLCSWNVHTHEVPTSQRPAWRPNRDIKLVGYSFIWMFPIYGLIVFMEPLSYYFGNLPWIARGIIYALIFTLVEFLAGWMIKKISGKCPWDYSYHKLSVCGYTRWDFIIVWFFASIILEHFLPVWIELTPHVIEAFSKL